MSATDAPPPGPPRRNLPLLLAGSLMLLAVFLVANPWSGVAGKAWPWDVFRDAAIGLRSQIVAAIWSLAGVLAVLFSFAGPVRLRALSVSALCLLLVLVCQERWHPTPFVLGDGAWARVLAGILLGAGLWLARSRGKREGSTSGRARAYALAGGVFFVWLSLTTFPGGAGGESPSRWGGLVETWRELWQAGGAAWAWGSGLWSSALPQTLLLVCAGFGILVGLGLGGPRATGLVLLLLLLTSLQGAVFGCLQAAGADPLPFTTCLTRAALEGGWFLSVFGALALADFARSWPGEDELEMGL